MTRFVPKLNILTKNLFCSRPHSEEDGEHENKKIWYYSTKAQLEELMGCLDKEYWEMDLHATLEEMKEEVQAHMDITEDLTSKARGNSKAYLTAVNGMDQTRSSFLKIEFFGVFLWCLWDRCFCEHQLREITDLTINMWVLLWSRRMHLFVFCRVTLRHSLSNIPFSPKLAGWHRFFKRESSCLKSFNDPIPTFHRQGSPSVNFMWGVVFGRKRVCCIVMFETNVRQLLY